MELLPTGTETRGAVLIWTALLSWITGGGSAEGGRKKGSDLALAGLYEGMLHDPVYQAPKGSHAGSFEVPDHPAGSLQTRGRWTFMLLAGVIQYLSTYWCVFFRREGLQEAFLRLTELPRGAVLACQVDSHCGVFMLPCVCGYLAGRSSSIAGRSCVFVPCWFCKFCRSCFEQLFKSRCVKKSQ